jgi:hypothetical protein
LSALASQSTILKANKEAHKDARKEAHKRGQAITAKR